MKTSHLSRRRFLERSATLAGALLLSSCSSTGPRAAARRTAADQVVLGNTRLNMQTVQVTPLGGGWGLPSYGILGRRDVLDLFAMWFDYKANTVAFAPYDK